MERRFVFDDLNGYIYILMRIQCLDYLPERATADHLLEAIPLVVNHVAVPYNVVAILVVPLIVLLLLLFLIVDLVDVVVRVD